MTKDEELEVKRKIKLFRNLELQKNLNINETEILNVLYGLLQNSVVGIAVINRDMEIVWMNDTLKKCYPHIHLLKKPKCYASFYGPNRKEVCRYCASIKVFENGKVGTTETDVAADGKIYKLVSTPIKDETGKVVYVIETVEDITNRKIDTDIMVKEHMQMLVTEKAKTIDSISLGVGSFLDNFVLELKQISEDKHNLLTIADYRSVIEDVRRRMGQFIKELEETSIQVRQEYKQAIEGNSAYNGGNGHVDFIAESELEASKNQKDLDPKNSLFAAKNRFVEDMVRDALKL